MQGSKRNRFTLSGITIGWFCAVFLLSFSFFQPVWSMDFQNGDAVTIHTYHGATLYAWYDKNGTAIIKGKPANLLPQKNLVTEKNAADPVPAGDVFAVVPLGGKKVALQTYRGDFVSIDLSNPKKILVAKDRKATANSTFELVDQANGSVALKASNGQYVSDQVGYVGTVPHLAGWEEFKLEKRPFFYGGKKIRLRVPNARYWSVNNPGWIFTANREEPGFWETFSVTSIEGSPTKVCIQSLDGMFLSKRWEMPEFPLIGGVQHLAGWEKFDVAFDSGNRELLTLKSVEGGRQQISGFAFEVVPPLPEPEFKTTYWVLNPFSAYNSLRCAYTTEHETIWCSKNQGPATVVTVGRPKVPDGWTFLGDIIDKGEKNPNLPCLIVRDNPDVLAKPVGFRVVWDDSRNPENGSCQHLTIWYPVPPKGFVSLGCVVTNRGAKPQEIPALANLRCVRTSSVMTADWDQEIWNSDAAKTKSNVGLVGIKAGETKPWDTTVNGALPLVPGTFISIRRDSQTAYLVHGNDGGGSYFKDFAPPGTVLVGLDIRQGWYTDGIRGLFQDPDNPNGPIFKSPGRGGTGGGERRAIKPGYVIGNLFYKRGDIIDGLVVHLFKLVNGVPDIKQRYGNAECRFESDHGDGEWQAWNIDREQADILAGIRGFCGSMLDGLGMIEQYAIPYALKGLTPEQVKTQALAAALAEGEVNKAYRVEALVDKKLEGVNNTADAPVQPTNEGGLLNLIKNANASASANIPSGPKAKEELVVSVPRPPTTPRPVIEPESRFKSLVDSLKQGPEANLKFGALPGFENVSFLKNAAITSPRISSGAQPFPWMCISGETSLDFPVSAGAVKGKFFVVSRWTKSEGIQSALMFFLSPSEVKKVGILGEVPLKYVFVTGCIMTYAPEAHSWDFAQFPENVRNEIKANTPIEAGEFRFAQSTGAVFGARPQDVPVLRDILGVFLQKVETMLFTVTFPKVRTDPTIVQASFNTDFKKLFPAFITLTDPKLEFQGLSNFALMGKLNLRLTSSLKVDGLALRIDLPIGGKKIAQEGMTLSVEIPGEWKNPLGIKGLAIGNLMISGQVGGTNGLSLGLKGLMDFGKRLEMAAVLSPASPVAVAAMSGKLDELSFKDLIKGVQSLLRQAAGAVKLQIPETPDLPIDIINLKKVEITISEVSNAALGLDDGLIVQGSLNIGGVDIGTVDIRVIPDKGLIAKGWVSKFKLGPIELTGVGPDRKIGTNDDCPYLDLEYLVDLEARPIPILETNGLVSGLIKLGPVVLDALFDMDKDSCKLTLVGNIANSFKIGLEGGVPIPRGFLMSSIGSMKLAGFVEAPYVGKLNLDVMDRVKSTPVVKDIIGFISGNIFSFKGITLNGNLEEISKAVIPGVKLGARILGKDLEITGPSLDLKEGAKFGEKIGKILYDEVVLKIKDLGIDIGKFFQNVGEETAKFAVNAANETAKAAVTAANEVANVGKTIGNTMADLGRTVGDEAKRLGNNIANGFIFVGGQIGTAFGKAGDWIKDNMNPANWF